MDIPALSMLTPVPYALIAILGYFIGCRNRRQLQLDNDQARLELKRAKVVAVDMNLRLRYAIDAAKAANPPEDKTQRAAKCGGAELEDDLQSVASNSNLPQEHPEC